MSGPTKADLMLDLAVERKRNEALISRLRKNRAEHDESMRIGRIIALSSFWAGVAIGAVAALLWPL